MTELEALDIEFPEVPCDGFLGRGVLRNRERWTYASILEDKKLEWRVTARRYEAEPDDFYNAWQYLNLHPMFWWFFGQPSQEHSERFHVKYLVEDKGVQMRLETWAAKVNPDTGRVDDNDALNTKTEIWLETGQWRWPAKDFREYDVPFHDYPLDCGGDTYEEAVIQMARNVHDMRGNDRMVCDGHRKTPRKLGEGNDDASA